MAVYKSELFLPQDIEILNSFAEMRLISIDQQGDYFIHKDTPEGVVHKIKSFIEKKEKYPSDSTTHSGSASSSMSVPSSSKLAFLNQEISKQYNNAFNNLKDQFDRLKIRVKKAIETESGSETINSILNIVLQNHFTVGSIDILNQIREILKYPICEEKSEALHVQMIEYMRVRFLEDLNIFLNDKNVKEYHEAYKEIEVDIDKFNDAIVDNLDNYAISRKYAHLDKPKDEIKYSHPDVLHSELIYTLESILQLNEIISDTSSVPPIQEKLIGEIQEFINVLDNQIESNRSLRTISNSNFIETNHDQESYIGGVMNNNDDMVE